MKILVKSCINKMDRIAMRVLRSCAGKPRERRQTLGKFRGAVTK